MNLQTRALAIAAGVGAAAQIVISIISSILSARSQANIINFDPTTGDLSQLGAFGGGTTLLLCCLALVIDLAVGFLYAYFHRQGAPLEIQDGIIGGALSDGIARLLGSIVSTCFALLLVPVMFGDTVPSEVVAFGLVGGAIGAVIGICIAVFFGLIFGAAGGALGAILLRGEKSAY